MGGKFSWGSGRLDNDLCRRVQWRISVSGFQARLFQKADLQPLRAARLPLGGDATTYFWIPEVEVGCKGLYIFFFFH